LNEARRYTNILWQYALRFRIEELFLDSKSGVFQLEDSRLRATLALERLYLVAAVALLYATTQGMAVQLAGLRTQVDPHWRRGISYLKIGLRYLQGVIHKGRQLLAPSHFCPTIRNPVLRLKRRNKHSMTRSGLPAFDNWIVRPDPTWF
jgi:hypothetical protein